MPRHLLDVDDLSDGDIESILAHAERLRSGEAPPNRAGTVLGLIFEEPSVRTKFGFAAAMARMGGTPIEVALPYQEAQMSGRESLADLVRSVGGYAHCLVARCATAAAAHEIATHAPVPVISAGTGGTAHPTQALIDLFAIRRRFDRLDGLRVGVMGDISSSRCARSLLRLLARFPIQEMRLVHPGAPMSPGSLGVDLLSQTEWRDLGATPDLTGLDVIYMPGFPAGGGPLAQDAERKRLRQMMQVDEKAVAPLADGVLILSPMPRVDEIAVELDDHPALGMFQQSQDGIYLRVALLDFFLRIAAL